MPEATLASQAAQIDIHHGNNGSQCSEEQDAQRATFWTALKNGFPLTNATVSAAINSSAEDGIVF
jgi:hypothetical protein